jgi:TRAP-type C4-dicarboxylate transport system substrate-binding protein
MKKGILLSLITVLFVISLVFASCTPPAPAQVIKLNYANFFPGTAGHSILAQLFCDEIKKQTNGGIEITYYPAGALAPAAKIADAIETGIADIGMSVVTYTMGKFPGSELVELPHSYPNGWVATQVANDFYTKFKPAEWNKVHVLYFHAAGPSVVFTTKKPVNKLDDMKGLVIRSTGIGAKIAEALGARGYAAGQGDAYELMSKGTIDGSYTPREVLKTWKQAEVVNNVTNTFAIGSTSYMFVTMNLAKWNALPKDYQDKINNISNDWIDKHGRVWTATDKDGIDYFLSMSGKKVIDLPADESAKFVAAAKPAVEAYIAERAAKGIPAQEYEKYLNERVSYWTGKGPSEKDCLDWYTKNIVPVVPAPTPAPAK